MSFRFSGAHLGQPLMFDAGETVSATSPSVPAKTTAPRDLTYKGKAKDALKKAPAASDVKKAQDELAKAEAARAQAGIKRFLDDVIRSQLTRSEVVSSKAAFDTAGRLASDRDAKKKAYENAVADKMRQIMRVFAQQNGYGVGFVARTSTPGSADNRFTRFVLAPKLAETLRSGPYGSWITSIDSDAFKRVNEELKNNAYDSGVWNRDQVNQFAKFPYADKVVFFKAAAAGEGFPAAGFSPSVVSDMGPRAYQSFIAASGAGGFSAASKTVETLVGNQLADVYGVPSGEVQRLRAAVLTSVVPTELYAEGRTAPGADMYAVGPSTPAYNRGAADKARKARDEANRKASDAARKRRETQERVLKAEQDKKKAEAEGNTSEAARLEQEKAALEQQLRDADAKAAEAERKAREAAAGAGGSMTVSSGGGGGGGAPSVSTGGETPVVAADEEGTVAIAVPDASVMPVAPAAPSKVSPVALLIAAAAIGGGIWWFSRRRGA